MTPIEDVLSRAFRAGADEIRPGTVPPLRLHARRRPCSLAYGGGERTREVARRGWLEAAGCAVLVAVVAAGSAAISHDLHPQAALASGAAAGHPGGVSATRRLEAAIRRHAAAWVAGQVSPDAIVSCDRLMCSDLVAHGFLARNVRVLGPASPYPMASTLVIDTPAVRKLFGASLGTGWAPAVLATFGTGITQITVRVIAPQGAAAYQAALSQDLATRKQSARALLGATSEIELSAEARRQLASGQVDERLLFAITALAARNPIDIVDFGNLATGASAGVPLRYADLADIDAAADMSRSAYVQSMVAVLSAEPAQLRPAHIRTATLTGGKAVLRIEFAGPSPLGLLGPTSKRSH
jgi:hypothetical protein